MLRVNVSVGIIMSPQPGSSPPIASSTQASLAEALRDAQTELIAETRLARGGLGALKRYTSRLDGLIRQIYADARRHTDTRVALIAIGGYGRRHMCLHSDVDLLLVFDGPVGAAEERMLKATLHPLWDLQLDLGHHVRELADVDTVESDNPEYLVALRHARFLDGDHEVFRRFTNATLRPGSRWTEPTLAALRDLTRQRHTQFNYTLYQLEPDIKDAPGALRDVTAARLIGSLSGISGMPSYDGGRLDEAEDFMLRLRSILHLERGRNLNILSHELQETAATLFGTPDEDVRPQVEALMSTYFHHARIINRALTVGVKSRDATSRVPKAVPVGEDLVRLGDEIAFADGTRASLRPRIWLGAFEAALDQDCGVSRQALTCIERHGERYAPERFFPTVEERDRLLRVLRPRPGLYDRLSEMHDSGLLGRMFPEFQKIYCLVIRDFYHKYTVDEHTLLTIKNVESLCTPTSQSRRRYGSLLTEVGSPELLVVALLFHDVGKWTNLNHSEEGVRMALNALRRIKVPESDIAIVEFLIRHHLQMSVAAFRRDTDDPETVKQFARLVGTEERLKLLCVLTLCDVGAVGPDVMTPWKEELLWRLYVDTYNQLTRGYGDEVIEERSDLEGLLDARPNDVSGSEVTAFLDGLPRRYLRSVEASRVYEHVRLARDLASSDAHCSLDLKDSVWELTVASVDRPQLYTKVCGVLSYFGMEILRGQAMSNRDGVAVDMFQFTDAERFLELNPSGRDEIIRRLQDVVADREDIDRMLQPKVRGLSRQKQTHVPTVVHIDNSISDRFTIAEIVAPDAWGLLYHISHAISKHGCDIELVLISTEGNRAIDVFHLTMGGAKLTAEESDALRAELEEALQRDEAH